MQYTASEIVAKANKVLNRGGYDCAPFKIEWYNETVGQPFKLDYPGDTLAVNVINTPTMFEDALKPFVCTQRGSSSRDPLDDCTAFWFDRVIQEFPPELRIEVLRDFDMWPSRKPKIIVQTSGHVAGQAYYYQRKDVTDDPWPNERAVYGVSVHPQYGGWFAFRGVLIFVDVQVPDLERVYPPDIVPLNEKRIELLEGFNFHWKNWSFRDVIPVSIRYSDEMKMYMEIPPGPKRRQFLGLDTEQEQLC